MAHIEAKYGGILVILAYGRFLFTTHSDSKIRVWNVSETDKYFKPKKAITLPQKRTIFMYPRKKNINQHKDSISCIAYDVADKLLICTRVLGSWDKTVTVWKVSDKICVDSFLAHKGQVNTAIAINQQDGQAPTGLKSWLRHLLCASLPMGVFYTRVHDRLISFWKKEKAFNRFNRGGFLYARP
ncbi:hypothetical protein LguiB_008352 [Lonicera macranthoides]